MAREAHLSRRGVLKQKQAGVAVPKGATAAPAANVVNLMDALRRSIAGEKTCGESKEARPGTERDATADFRKEGQRGKARGTACQ
jgi:non-homologous end joining protein Ku